MKRLFVTFLLLPLISFSQNVGIGTSTPAEKLQVSGNIKADTIKPGALKLTPNAGAGKILTSDASGNANWQAGNVNGGAGFGAWGDCSMNGISGYNPVADSTAIGDNFGHSVSVHGNFAIVGAPFDDGAGGADQGSASIYQFNGTNWEFIQKITDAAGLANDHFGRRVSISGSYAVIGSPEDDGSAGAEQGSFSVYQYNGSSWVLMQKITDAAGAAGDNLGYGVSVLGNYIIAGSPGDDAPALDQGSASIYQYNGSSWVLMQKITEPAGASADGFGASVSISGNNVIVGSPYDDGTGGAEQGSINFFRYNGATWLWINKITDPAGAANDLFGISVSISGNYAITGAYLDDVGVNNNQGSVHIYYYDGTNWGLMQKITNPAGVASDLFGFSVSISGDYAIAGSYGTDVPGGTNQGAATIYSRVGLAWVKLQIVLDPAGISNDAFGYDAAIDGASKRFLTGTFNYASGSGKAVFGKLN